MKVKKLINALHRIAPPALAEKWDNVGLQTGNYNSEITKVAISLDIWSETVQQCVKLGCNTIISHHPLIFRPIKKITGGDYVSDTLIFLLDNKINYIAAHTNLDFTLVSSALARKCGATEIRPLSSVDGATLSKLIIFVPISHKEKVLNAIFKVGGGEIGDYSNCSFSADGTGSFKAGGNSNPFIGSRGILEQTKEARIEVVMPSTLVGNALSAARNAHPYEEMAYDVYSLSNKDPRYSFGVIGLFTENIPASNFIATIKKRLPVKAVRVAGYSPDRNIKKVAFAGGSAFECYKAAVSKGCDAFVVGECGYHDMFAPALNGPMVIEVGHGESEFPVVAELHKKLSEALKEIDFICLEPQYPSEIL